MTGCMLLQSVDELNTAFCIHYRVEMKLTQTRQYRPPHSGIERW